MNNIDIRPIRVTQTFGLIILLLSIANIAAVWMLANWGVEDSRVVQRYVDLFYFGWEQNVPSLYSALALLATGLLLFFVSAATKASERPYVRHWFFLGLLFVFLSMDEALELHEHLVTPFRSLMGDSATGFFYYAWIIPYGILVIVLGLAYLKFFLNMPRWFFAQCFVSGIVFVGGAIGVEGLGGAHDQVHGEDATLSILATIEETLEMVGVVIFIDALCRYLSRELPGSRIGVGSA